MADTVKLTHPDAKGTLTVSVEQAPMYLSQGWVEKPAK